jgi:hypothetical protein
MKFYRASSHVKVLKFSDVSGTDSVSEMLENFNILTPLLARENFVEFCRRENIKYIYIFCFINLLYQVVLPFALTLLMTAVPYETFRNR